VSVVADTAASVAVLIVDDEPAICEILGQIMAREGYSVITRSDPCEALDVIREEEPTILLSDVRMPGMSGIELLERVREAHPNVGVLLITAVDDKETAITALKKGAYGYITKPFSFDEVAVQVAGAVYRRNLEIHARAHSEELEGQVSDRTRRLRRTMRELEVSNRALSRSYEDTIMRLAAAAEYRDEESGQHIRRMSKYCRRIAEELQLDADFVRLIELASPMHDVGKIGVADRILRKPGKLTPEEFDIMKTHCVIGARLLEGSDVPLLQMGVRVALNHHERIDGSGYPNGLAGEAIPLEGRIVAVADVFDALTTERVYKPAYEADVAFNMMQAQRGIHFDVGVLDAFLGIQGEILRIRSSFNENVAQVASA